MVVPLIIEVQNGQTETIKILLSAGADVNGKNELEENALQIASSRGHYEIVRLLLEAQATTNSAIERVAEEGHDKCLNLLVQAKFDMKECSVALHKAALKGKTDCVYILINAGADINSHNRGFDYLDYHDNNTALFKAAKGNHVQCVKNLIEAGTGVNDYEPGVFCPDAFHNPLYIAAKNGSVECVGYLFDAKPNMRTVAGALVRHCEEGSDLAVEMLIKAGADVNWEHEEFCLTPLEAAAKHGHSKCIQLLLQAGVDKKLIKPRFYRPNPALLAIAGGHYSCMSILIAAGAIEHWPLALSTAAAGGHEDCMDLLLGKVDNPQDLGRALADAAAEGRLNCIKKLLDAGADVNVTSVNDQTPLTRAAETGQDKAMEILLKEGVNMNARDTSNKTALIHAVENRFYKCVELLIQAGVDVNTKGCNDKSALDYAVDSGIYDILKSFIAAGADVNTTDKEGNTPLLRTVQKLHTEFATLLISAGADVNAANNEGVTPLNFHNIEKFSHHYNRYQKHVQCMNLLLNTKAIDVNAVDQHGVTPLISAARNRHVDCLNSLLGAGADVNKTDYRGSSALNRVASWDVKCSDVLISAGADMNLSNSDGYSSLMFAAANYDPECAQRLLDAGADLNATMKNGNTVVFSAIQNNSECTAKWAYLRGISVNLKNIDGQNLPDYHLAQQSFNEQTLMVVIAAGEFVDPNERDVIVQKIRKGRGEIPEALPSEEELQCSLKQICREAIRGHLLHTNPNENLFVRVPKLGLPPTLERYLLYGFTLTTEWY